MTDNTSIRPQPDRFPSLSAEDRRRLAAWSARYDAEAVGFSRPEAERLAFARYLVREGRMTR